MKENFFSLTRRNFYAFWCPAVQLMLLLFIFFNNRKYLRHFLEFVWLRHWEWSGLFWCGMGFRWVGTWWMSEEVKWNLRWNFEIFAKKMMNFQLSLNHNLKVSLFLSTIPFQTHLNPKIPLHQRSLSSTCP